MKRSMFSRARIVLTLLVLIALAACAPPLEQPVAQSTDSRPAGSLSVDDLLANLDALQGGAAQGVASSGRSVVSTAAGQQLSLTDVAAYLNTIKPGLGNAVKAHGPYLVLPVPVPAYPSKNAKGDAVTLSGLMWVPVTFGRPSSLPVIAFQHGTQVYRPSAPSRFNLNPLAVFSSPDQSGAFQNYVECIVGGLMASAGYIVVMPDYPGFGSNTDDHPFVHMSLGNSVRDLVLAASHAQLFGGLKANGKIYLTGYSEGGYVTIAGAQALQAAGVPINGIVPCDGPYSLSQVMLAQMTTSGLKLLVPSYALYTGFGYHSVYPADFDFGFFFQDKYAAMLPDLFNGTHTNAEVGAAVPAGLSPADSILTPAAVAGLLGQSIPAFGDLKANDSFRSIADGTSIWVPSAQLYFIHCPVDDVVPYQNALDAVDALNTADGLNLTITNVQPVPFVAQVLGSNHVAAFPTAMLAAFTRIDGLNRAP